MAGLVLCSESPKKSSSKELSVLMEDGDWASLVGAGGANKSYMASCEPFCLSPQGSGGGLLGT